MSEYLDHLYRDETEEDPRPAGIGACPHCGYVALLTRITVAYDDYTWRTYGCVPCGMDKDRWRASNRADLKAKPTPEPKPAGKVRSVSRIETDASGRIVGVVKEEWPA